MPRPCPSARSGRRAFSLGWVVSSAGVALWLWWSCRQRVGHALALVIVPAVQHGEEIHVPDERRLAAERRFVRRLDVLALVEVRLVSFAGAGVGIDEHAELGIA